MQIRKTCKNSVQKRGECNEICVEVVRNHVSGDGAGGANQPGAQTQETKAPPPITAAEVQALKDAIAAQQAALAVSSADSGIADELHRRIRPCSRPRSAATDAASKADARPGAGRSAAAGCRRAQTDVSDLKTNVTNTAVTVQETQKNVISRLGEPARSPLQGNHHYARRIRRG